MNKNKGFIGIGLIIAVILGIVVVGGGAYFLVKNSNNIKKYTGPENTGICGPNGEFCPGTPGYEERMKRENQNLPVVDNKPTSVSSLVTVVSPNGGEVYKDTDKIAIKWKGNGKDRAAIYLIFSSGEWCFVKDIPSSDLSYTFVPSGHNCGEGRGIITSGNYKATLILYDNAGMAPEPGTAFATSYNDGDDASYNIDSSDNYFTINSGTKVVTLDMSSELARTYTTAFTEALKKPANFDGHYVVASWGCGSGCLAYGIVDKLTGKAYQGPSDDYGNKAGYSGDTDFNKTRWSINSNLFKVIGYTSIDTYKFENEKFTKTGSTPLPKN